MTIGNENAEAPSGLRETANRRFGCLQVVGLLATAVILTAVLTGWWVKHYLYASPLTPTELSEKERKTLNTKLAALDAAASQDHRNRADTALRPEAYSEEGARRDVSFTEKELNALIASDPETAKHVALDLADELVSLKLVVPLEEEVPVFGGKTLRLNMGIRLAYRNGQAVVALKGVSLGGIPLPNAWLGNLKNVNLVEEFGSQGGFWKLFSDGVEDLSVREGKLWIRLRE